MNSVVILRDRNKEDCNSDGYQDEGQLSSPEQEDACRGIRVGNMADILMKFEGGIMDTVEEIDFDISKRQSSFHAEERLTNYVKVANEELQKETERFDEHWHLATRLPQGEVQISKRDGTLKSLTFEDIIEWAHKYRPRFQD